MKNYDMQRDAEIETYSKQVYDEEKIEIEKKIEQLENTLCYLQDSMVQLSNSKDILKDIGMYSHTTALQTMIDTIDIQIIEIEIKKIEYTNMCENKHFL